MAPRAALLVAAAAAGAGLAAGFVQVEPTRGLYVDDAGRVLVFHGLNAVTKLSPWYPVLNGFDTTSTLSDIDMANLQSWGFNVLRLGVMWEGVEPDSVHAPGVYNATYLSIMVDLVERLGGYGIYSLADVHEDSLSRYYCGEGVPDAYIDPNSTAFTFPFPLPMSLPPGPDGYPNLTACQAVNFGLYLFTVQEQATWGDVYANASFSRAFDAFWGAVGAAFVNSTYLLG